MGKKYIIEMEDKPFHKEDGDFLYRVKGFNSLVFDMTGIGMLTPYTEPDLEQVRKEAFDDGYKEGMQLSIDDAKLKEEYQRGLADSWEACKKIINMNAETSEKVFGEGKWFTKEVVEFNTATEAIAKIKKYEEDEQRIKVWDEIYCVGCPDIKVCVTDIEYGNFSGFTVEHPDNSNIGHVYSNRSFAGWKKTGRHFTEIGAVLEKMREEQE